MMELNWEWLPLLAALALALSLSPWRMLKGGNLATPLLASLVFFPWLWALPRMHAMPIPLILSGSCLMVLMLGWPLAVPVICLIAAISGLLSPAPVEALIANAFWIGVLPATLALWLGALVRRYIGPHVFVSTLGRGFLVSALSVFGSSLLGEWAGADLPILELGLIAIAPWLLACGVSFMICTFGVFC